MDLTPALLLRLLRLSIISPRAGAAAVLDLGFAPIVGWLTLLLMAILSTLLTHLSFAIFPLEVQDLPAEVGAMLQAVASSPVRASIFQWALMLISVHATYLVGRWCGGTGSLAGAVILFAWLQLIWIVLQVAQLISLVLVPPLAGFVGLVTMVLFLRLFTIFVMQLHGFTSAFLTFFGIILASIPATFALAFIFVLLFGSLTAGV